MGIPPKLNLLREMEKIIPPPQETIENLSIPEYTSPKSEPIPITQPEQIQIELPSGLKIILASCHFKLDQLLEWSLQLKEHLTDNGIKRETHMVG